MKNLVPISIASLIVIAVAAFVMLRLLPTPSQSPRTASTTGTLATPTEMPAQPAAPAESLYEDELGFSLRVPLGMVGSAMDESGGARTLIFEPESGDISKGFGFQVYITPYEDSAITPEQLKEDASGPVLEPQEAMVGEGSTIRALIFKSSALALGETREAWLIHGGYLLEFTTPLRYDAELAAVLRTLSFPML